LRKIVQDSIFHSVLSLAGPQGLAPHGRPPSWARHAFRVPFLHLFLCRKRARGSTVLRLVASGFATYNRAVFYVLPFPAIDPVFIQVGPIAIRWYALAYVVGILVGWRYTRSLAGRGDSPLTPVMLDDFVTWAVLGIVLGGRLGYIVFYD